MVMTQRGRTLNSHHQSSECRGKRRLKTSVTTLREMRGEMMSLTAAVRGLTVLLLSVSAVHDDWSVSYYPLKICAPTGSTVNMDCTFTYPARINKKENILKKRFWFTSVINNEYKDVEKNLSFSGRVKNTCVQKKCSLEIKNLRKNDIDEYKFRFETNQDKFYGHPGVALNVTDLEVQVSRQDKALLLECLSTCPDDDSFVWFENGQIIEYATSRYYLPVQSFLTGRYSCALQGYEKHPSPSVYAPNHLRVSGLSSAEIKSGNPVTLTCSSDANPAANYTWYKINEQLQFYPNGPTLSWNSIESSNSGKYRCEAVNLLGNMSETVTINVQYAPRLPSVSVSPSAEIVEGSSVTLTCSSDANPAANYTWYKENEDSPVASGQIFTITNVRAEHSGNYSCEANNKMGHHNATFTLTVVSAGVKLPIAAGLTAVVILVIVSVSVLLWIRKKRASKETSQAVERRDNRHQSFEQRPRSEREPEHEKQSPIFIHHPDQGELEDELQYASVQFSQHQTDLYCNVRPARPIRHTEKQDLSEYTAVRFTGNATRPRRQEDIELYCTVNKH